MEPTLDQGYKPRLRPGILPSPTMLPSFPKLILLSEACYYVCPECSSSPFLPVPILSFSGFELKGYSVLPTPGHGVTSSTRTQHFPSKTLSKVVIVYISVTKTTQSLSGIWAPGSQGLHLFCSLLNCRAQHIAWHIVLLLHIYLLHWRKTEQMSKVPTISQTLN